MVKRNEVIDWHKYFTYKDGKLFHKYRDFGHKSFNTKHAGKQACKSNTGFYKAVKHYNKGYYAHRVIWEMHNGKIPEGMQIDHINLDKHDNHIENLQLVTQKQNNNRKHHASKGYSIRNDCVARPYHSCRTDKYFGTPCGAYMSFMTAFVQGENYGNSR